jgi:hypothetical protein
VHIAFTNSLEDYLAFGEYHYHNSSAIRRSRYITQGIPAVLLLYFIGLYLFGGQKPTVFFWIFLALAFLVFTRLYHKRNYLKRLTKMYHEGILLNTSDAIDLTIHEDGLAVHAGEHQGEITWQEIEHVDTTDSHTFVYTGPFIALIIPREKVSIGDFESFIGELKSRLDRFRSVNRN